MTARAELAPGLTRALAPELAEEDPGSDELAAGLEARLDDLATAAAPPEEEEGG